MTDGTGRLAGGDPPRADDLVGEQIAYYRARAPWYDDWWEATRTYALPARELREWLAERSVLEDDLDGWARGHRGAELLELAAGTGNLTRIVARHAGRITAIDASPEVLERNAAKVGPGGPPVEHRLVDLFAWEPDRTWAGAYFGFWISHVPPGRWAGFWATLHRALAVGGDVWFCDNAAPAPASSARGGCLGARSSSSRALDGTIDLATGVHERALPDGRRFRLVKRFHEPRALVEDLAARGFDAEVRTTRRAFLYGRASVR